MGWSLLKSKGIDALINDDLTGFAILGSVLGHIGSNAPEMYAFFGFLVGFYLCLTILQIVTSCVITLFVCYAEDPHAMSENRPLEYNKIERARKNLGNSVTADPE